MKKAFLFFRCLMTAGLCLGLVACAHTPAPPAGHGERLIYASQTPPPSWIYSVPEAAGRFLYFVGISGETVASDQKARGQAEEDARKQVVEYYGTMVRTKVEKISASFGLSSSVVDPTMAAREFEKQLAANVAKLVKAKEYYSEKWEKPTGIGWKVYALCRVPKGIADESFKSTAEENITKAQEEARDATTRNAKKQAEEVIEFWKKAKEEGLIE